MSAKGKDRDRQVGQCLIGIRQGNTQSISELFALTYKSLYAVAMKYCRHPMTAEDLVAELFADIDYIASHYKESLNAFNYLCKIIKNKYLNMIRGEKGKACEPLNENLFSTKQEIDEKVSSITVREGLKLLDKEEYAVVYCKFYLDMTFREIAKRLAKSLGSVERTYRRAIVKLKDYL